MTEMFRFWASVAGLAVVLLLNWYQPKTKGIARALLVAALVVATIVTCVFFYDTIRKSRITGREDAGRTSLRMAGSNLRVGVKRVLADILSDFDWNTTSALRMASRTEVFLADFSADLARVEQMFVGLPGTAKLEPSLEKMRAAADNARDTVVVPLRGSNGLTGKQIEEVRQTVCNSLRDVIKKIESAEPEKP
jgi:hypothetical protein